MIQLAVYAAVVAWLASRFENPEAGAFAIGLLLNPVLVALVADVLTEGPSMILILLALACLVQADRGRPALAWLTLGASVSNFAPMVRPANLVLLIAWNVGVVTLLCRHRSPRLAAGYAVAFVATGALALLPQYLIAGSLLPQGGSLAFQTMFGIGVMKYASAVDPAGVAQSLVIPNPWCTELSSYASAWMWHVAHPWNSLATMAAHVFASFTFETPFTYVYATAPAYSALFAGAMWFAAAVGALNLGIVAHRLRLTPIVAMVATLFVLTLGLVSLIAVENRFNLVPVAVLSVLAAHFALRKATPAARAAVLMLALCVAVIGAIASHHMQASARVLPALRHGWIETDMN